MFFEIFRKEFGGYHNYFFINLILPKIRIGKKEKAFYSLYYLFDFDFPTHFVILKDEISWNFKLSILGIGIEIYRQWNY